MCKLNAEASCVSNFTPLWLLQGKKFKFTFFVAENWAPYCIGQALPEISRNDFRYPKHGCGVTEKYRTDDEKNSRRVEGKKYLNLFH